MENRNRTEASECQQAQTLLSDYMENTLSGREAWNIEKHLTACPSCAQYLREMQATVTLLQTAPRLDTSDDFMARLHAKLDQVEPAKQSPLARFADWRDRLADFGALLRSPRLPALSLSLSAVALIAALTVNQWTPVAAPAEQNAAPVSRPAVSATATLNVNHNVALSASNPFDDPAAANLEAQSQPDANDSNPDNENTGS